MAELTALQGDDLAVGPLAPLLKRGLGDQPKPRLPLCKRFGLEGWMIEDAAIDGKDTALAHDHLC